MRIRTCFPPLPPGDPHPSSLQRSALIFVLLLCLAPLSWAADPAVFQFDDPEKEAQFQRLTQELRCLVCQNQSLADSHADLAGDLRREIHGMIQRGQSDKAIIDFMVQRYGDFVLYRPPVSTRTYALWFGPAVLLMTAVVLFFRTLRRRSREAPAPALSPEERKRIARMLEDDD